MTTRPDHISDQLTRPDSNGDSLRRSPWYNMSLVSSNVVKRLGRSGEDTEFRKCEGAGGGVTVYIPL